MNTRQNTRPQQPQTQPKPTRPKEDNADTSQSSDSLQQLLGLLGPMIEFHKADETLTKDDVRLIWDVRAIRGKDEPLIHIKGGCTMHHVFARLLIVNAIENVEMEITQKITRPLTAKFQCIVNDGALDEAFSNKGKFDPDEYREDETFDEGSGFDDLPTGNV